MSAVVQGTLVPMSALADLTDWVAVKKVGGFVCTSRLLGSRVGLPVQQTGWGPHHQGNTR